MGRLPDFLLIGAMRAGTTTLHRLLAAHPGVYMPVEEVFFFDFDDFEEHAESFVGADGWRPRDFDRELAVELPAYEARFAAAGDRICGEDSTTYLTAARAPERAARLCPEARIIAILRNPVDRAWSHYWHMVNSGRAVFDFETSLLAQRGTLLKRGDYALGLRRWFAAVPPERRLVLVFEEMVRDLQGTFDRVTSFLGLPDRLDIASLADADRHQHRGDAPGELRLRLRFNLDSRLVGPPGRPMLPTRRPGGLASARLRFAGQRKIPPMAPETRSFLDGVFRSMNTELPTLLGRDLPW